MKGHCVCVGGESSGLHRKLQQGLEDWKITTELLVLLTLYKVNETSLCKPIYPFHMRTKPGQTRVSGSIHVKGVIEEHRVEWLWQAAERTAPVDTLHGVQACKRTYISRAY